MFFDGKSLVFSFNSEIWVKMFTSLVKTFRQAYQNFNLPVQWSILKFFLKWMIHIFSFLFENWAKSIRFWQKNFGKVVKTRCLEEHFEEKCFFLFENLQKDFLPFLSGLFLKLGETVAAVLTKQFFTCPEKHVEEKCFSFDENPFFIWTSSKKFLFFGNTLSARMPEQYSTYKEGRSWALYVFQSLNEHHQNRN